MLKGIIEGREVCPIVVIEDCMENLGVPLLKTFIAALAKRCETVHLITYEYPQGLFNGFTDHVSARLNCLNAASDPLAWDIEKKPVQNAITMDTDLYANLTESQPMKRENQKVAVVIDCLSNLILHRSAGYTCQVLHRLGSWKSSQDVDTTQVVALVHGDLHDDVTVGMLRHTADAVINLDPGSDAVRAHCRLLHKKSSGKITRTVELFSTEGNFENFVVEDYKPTSLPVEVPEDSPDPAANLTFNLKLTDAEKEARSQVILPYMKQQQLTQENTGKVFYEPDEADDYDEEDPDDDLDI